jgi:hypothetical protein
MLFGRKKLSGRLERFGGLFPIESNPEVLHHQQNPGDDCEQTGDPDGNRKPEQEIQAENEEKEGKE